jgi:hypothetical protein
MTADNDQLTVDGFIEVVYRDVFRAATRDSLALVEAPPGRQPPESLMALHRWFSALGSDDREMVGKAMAFAADSAVFGLLCLLDNVRPVTAGYRETLALKVRSGSDERDLAPDGVELHAEFRGRVDSEPAQE